MSTAYKLAVLDIAGTTVVDKDFVAIAFVEAFMQYGIDLKIEEINPLMGFKKTEAIATVLQRKKIEVRECLLILNRVFRETHLTSINRRNFDIHVINPRKKFHFLYLSLIW